MSCSNSLVSSHSEREDGKINNASTNSIPCSEDKAILKVSLENKPDAQLVNLPEEDMDLEDNGDDCDDEVFVDVDNTNSWAKDLNRQDINYCGLDEPSDSFSDLSAKSGEEGSVENNSEVATIDLLSNLSEAGDYVNDLSSVESAENTSIGNYSRIGVELQSNLFVSEDSVNNLTTFSNDVEISIENGPECGVELLSNHSQTGMSVQTDISVQTAASSTRSDENISVGNEPDVGTELQSNGSDTGVSFNNLSSTRSDEDISIQSDPEAGHSFKSDDSITSISMILSRSVRSENQDFCFGTTLESGVNLLLDKCQADASNDDRSNDISDDNISADSDSTIFSTAPLEECKGSISINKPMSSCDVTSAETKLVDGVNFPLEESHDEFVSIDKPEQNVDGKLDSGPEVVIDLDSEGCATIETSQTPSSDQTGGNNNNGIIAEDSETRPFLQSTTCKSIVECDSSEIRTDIEIVDSPTQLTIKSLEVLCMNSAKEGIPEEMHNSKSFGIPQKKSSKNRSACSLVKHVNSVEIIRTKSEQDHSELSENEDEDDDEDDDDNAGLGYSFANKSSSSLGKHRDSVELLCGKRFDSGISMQTQKMSFMNSVDDDDDDNEGNEKDFRTRSGLLKIKESVEIIGIGDEDMDIGDVNIESSSRHSPRSILKINKPRSKENECSNTRLVSWKDTSQESQTDEKPASEAIQFFNKSSAETFQLENKSAAETVQLDKNSTEISQLDNQSAEISQLDKKSTEISQLDKKSTVISQLENKSAAETVQLDKNSTEISQLDKKSAEISQLDNQSAEISQLDKKSTEISQLGQKSAEISQLDNKSAKICHLDNKLAEISQLDNKTTKISQLDKSTETSQLNKSTEAGRTEQNTPIACEPGKKPRSAKKSPPVPKVGNLIKLFSSKKSAFDESSASNSAKPCDDVVHRNKSVVEEAVTDIQKEMQNETQNETADEADACEIKKTFTFWKKVSGANTGEKDDDECQPQGKIENDSSSALKSPNLKIIEKPVAEEGGTPEVVGCDDGSDVSLDSGAISKKHHKFAEKFEGSALVPNPMFKKFPLPLENTFVKDRVSVLERSSSGQQENTSVKSSEIKSVKN